MTKIKRWNSIYSFDSFHFLFDKKNILTYTNCFLGDFVLETLHENYRKWTKKYEMCYIHTDMGQLPLYQQYERIELLVYQECYEKSLW